MYMVIFMKIMLRLLLLFCAFFMLSFCITVSARNVSLTDMVEIINEGVITKEFIDSKLNEKDDNNSKKWKDVTIFAQVVNEQLLVNFSYSNGTEVTSGNVVAKVLDDGKTLSSTIEYNDDENYHYENEIEVHDLLPLWEIEASEGFKTVKEYVDSDYISKLNSIIDRCYREKMHVCRTSVNSYKNHVYTSDVELDEGSVNYVISVLKEEKKSADNKKMVAVVGSVALILIVIFLIFKSSQPKLKTIKY